MTNQEYRTVALMRKCGGGFFARLAEAAMYASKENLSQIKMAWPVEWQKHFDAANPAPRQEPSPKDVAP